MRSTPALSAKRVGYCTLHTVIKSCQETEKNGITKGRADQPKPRRAPAPRRRTHQSPHRSAERAGTGAPMYLATATEASTAEVPESTGDATLANTKKMNHPPPSRSVLFGELARAKNPAACPRAKCLWFICVCFFRLLHRLRYLERLRDRMTRATRLGNFSSLRGVSASPTCSLCSFPDDWISLVSFGHGRRTVLNLCCCRPGVAG